jgi:hypothetical protein
MFLNNTFVHIKMYQPQHLIVHLHLVFRTQTYKELYIAELDQYSSHH